MCHTVLLCITLWYVTCVGIRELRQNLSVYLAKVKAGQTLAVTDRGNAVAVLKPLDREYDLWQRLVDQGAVIPAVGSWSDIELLGGEIDENRTGSKILQNMRQERL